jgi:Flp pilus assembly protein TadB
MNPSDAAYRRNEWWRPVPAQPNLRIGDAERHEIAELLSKHFADGRLDDAEFNERLDKAMSAKTQSDLSGLLVDLPGVSAPPAPPERPRHRGAHLAVLVLAVLVAMSAIGSLVRPHVPWFLIIVAFVVVAARRRSHRRRRFAGPFGY